MGCKGGCAYADSCSVDLNQLGKPTWFVSIFSDIITIIALEAPEEKDAMWETGRIQMMHTEVDKRSKAQGGRSYKVSLKIGM